MSCNLKTLLKPKGKNKGPMRNVFKITTEEPFFPPMDILTKKSILDLRTTAMVPGGAIGGALGGIVRQNWTFHFSCPAWSGNCRTDKGLCLMYKNLQHKIWFMMTNLSFIFMLQKLAQTPIFNCFVDCYKLNFTSLQLWCNTCHFVGKVSWYAPVQAS